MAKPNKEEIRLGAIYVFGIKRGFGAADLSSLLRSRCGFPDKKADQLAGHWVLSWPYRNPKIWADERHAYESELALAA